jgi:hypothetical protein
MTDHLTAAYAEDIQIREQGLEHQTPGGLKVIVHEIKPGVIYKKDGVTVTAIQFPMDWKDRFRLSDRLAGPLSVISGTSAE